MLFSSITFISVFLPTLMLLYYVLPKVCRNYVLLVTSFIFYAWGEPVYFFLLLVSIFINWLAGVMIDRFRGQKGYILLLAVLSNVGILGYYKYAGITVETLNALLRTNFANPKIALPLGISFFTFKALSYITDIYKEECPALKNILTSSCFPQLISSPIH